MFNLFDLTWNDFCYNDWDSSFCWNFFSSPPSSSSSSYSSSPEGYFGLQGGRGRCGFILLLR